VNDYLNLAVGVVIVPIAGWLINLHARVTALEALLPRMAGQLDQLVEHMLDEKNK